VGRNTVSPQNHKSELLISGIRDAALLKELLYTENKEDAGQELWSKTCHLEG
jgi:hypothetical protein